MTNKPQFVGECKRVKLNEICSKGKSSLRQKDVINDGPYSVYGASGIVGTTSDYQNEIPYVAVIKDGAGVGRANACEPMTSVLGTMQALIPNPNVERDYLLYLVRSLRLGEGFSGSTIPHIYFKDYGKIEVPLPSLEAQKWIVSQLGLIEAQIEQAEAQITQLDQLVKSRFVEMFLNGDYPEVTIGECASDIHYGTSEKASSEGKFTYLRMNNMTDGGALCLDDVKRITLEGKSLENCLVRKGDLLFNRTNSREKVGKTCIFSFDEPMVIAGYIIRVRLKQSVDSEYLSVFMNLSTTKARLRSMAKGAVHQANINAKQLSSVKFPLPPLELQKEFVSLVRQVDKSRFVDLRDEGRELLLKFEGRQGNLQLRQQALTEILNIGPSASHCFPHRIGL